LSEWDETDTTIARPRLLDRAEIPVDTVQLARFLIGKMLVRVLADGVAAGRINGNPGNHPGQGGDGCAALATAQNLAGGNGANGTIIIEW
jgi:hypothetical protein